SSRCALAPGASPPRGRSAKAKAEKACRRDRHCMSEDGPRVQAPFGRRFCEVTINESFGPYRLFGAEDPDGPEPLPGQFYMLMAAEHWGGSGGQRPYLARAFSVCRTRKGRLDFLVDDIG